MYIAHFRSSDGEIQEVCCHLLETKALAEEAGSKIGLVHLAGLTALLHDFGKLSQDFQNYIQEAYNNPTHPPKRGSVDHSTAGAHFLWQRFANDGISKAMLEPVCNSIYTHHNQLLDFIDREGYSPFYQRMQKEVQYLDELEQIFYQEVMSEKELIQYFQLAKEEFIRYLKRITIVAKEPKSAKRIAMTMLNKLLYSILIDSDRLNARHFDENIQNPTLINSHHIFNTALQNLESFLEEKQKTSLPNNITKLRQEMSNQCFEKSKLPTGIYTLSIPTGGGKTFASLRFALNHAQQYNKQRIIYIIPFTTVIEQNAKEVRDVLKIDDILEHHSNVVDITEGVEELTYEQLMKKRKLEAMKDNWDSPIIFTTLVQFLNVIFNGKSRNLRRMHNLANSILIFDEVQSLPVSCVSLFNTAIQYLKDFMNTTTILCTATQPALNFVKYNLSVDAELVENLPDVVNAFKRTNVHSLIRASGWYTVDLAEFIEDKLETTKNILVVMNNKSVVRKLFDELNERGIAVYHLSTAMCPAHRKEMIKDIRRDLKEDKKFVCVSTQLIEAGVDVSFECVMRSLAGIDSIAQSAGRCNRHGEAELKDVYVFNHAEENLSRLETIAAGAKCSANILRDMEKDGSLYGGDLLSPNAIQFYFQQYYTDLQHKLDYPISGTTIWSLLYGANNEEIEYFEKSILKSKYPFANRSAIRSAANEFKVIDAETTPVLVPYSDEGEELIAELTSETFIDNIGQFMKKAQQYSVNVFPFVKEQLFKNGLVSIVDLGFMQVIVAKEGAYDKRYGLDAAGEAKFDASFI